MTCRQCLHYSRNVKRQNVCKWPEGNGLPIKGKIDGGKCKGFEPKRRCCTCAFRCFPNDFHSMYQTRKDCPRWQPGGCVRRKDKLMRLKRLRRLIPSFLLPPK